MALESADLKVRVIPLPEKDRPQDFSGAVGDFSFDMTVSPEELKVGDPLTVRMQVLGQGNLKTVAMPSLKSFDAVEELFKFYDPQVREEEGAKILEQVVIPKKENISEFPAVNFSYFDTQDNVYHTITRGPFPLKVRPPAEGEELKVVGLGGTAAGLEPYAPEEKLGHDINFIKGHAGSWQPVGLRFYARPGYILGVGFLIAAWAGIVVLYHFTHRIKTDAAFARRLQAPRFAKKGLSQAKTHLAQGDPKKFYDTLFQVLQKYFGNKFHMASGTVTLENIQRILKDRGAHGTVMDDIRTVFEECDIVRFAAMDKDSAAMRASYARVEKIIDHMERRWR